MNTDSVMIEAAEMRKILGAANGDAALLYIYLRAGNNGQNAEADLNMNSSRFGCAMAVLRQLGLWSDEKPARVIAGERPSYTEYDVLEAGEDVSFRGLCDEVQRLLGRRLNTEELKILLGFVRYLGLPYDVISVLVCYCKDRARSRGSLRNPSLRTIEKEAYAWAEQGIDSLEGAAAYIQDQNLRHSRMARLMGVLQIRGRSLTPAEEKYAVSWIDMGFDDEVIGMAYERTCLNTGGLNWAYMNKILTRWHESGLMTAEAIRSGDRRPGAPQKNGERPVDADEQAAIARMLREG